MKKIMMTLLGLGILCSSHAVYYDNHVTRYHHKSVQLSLVNDELPIEDYYFLGGGEQVRFAVDDGSAEQYVGDFGQFVWFNRFTPDPSVFPFQLEEVSVTFGVSQVNVGDPIEIVIYQDTDGDGDPGTGAELLANFRDEIQFNDGMRSSSYVLRLPVVFTGPGDVLIGFVNRASFEGAGDFPAGIDFSPSMGRSWFSSYLSGDVPVNPTFPGDHEWGLIDSFNIVGNWVLRGRGTTGFLLGGEVTGLLPGNNMILQNNLADDLFLVSSGSYFFEVLSQDTDAYDVTILQQPSGQTCMVNNGTGTVNADNVDNINIICELPDEIFVNGFE